MDERLNFYPNIRNTCALCGEPTEGVYAPNRDLAVAGVGLCGECAGEFDAPVDVDATDGARQLAEEAGVDLAVVAAGLREMQELAAGPGAHSEPVRRITKADVQAWLGGADG